MAALRVAAVQHDIVWEDRESTLARLAPLVDKAVAGGAELVVLAEMFAVGFSMGVDRIAEPPDGPTTAWLVAQAEAHEVSICGSVPVQVAGAERPSNTFVLAGPDGRVERYAKRHPFSLGHENRHYSPGDRLLTVEVGGLRVSPAVCYDLRFADQFWSQGPTTDCFVVVANWPAARASHWGALLVARAIENQAWVVGVNRVGPDGNGYGHSGGTCVVDPLGRIVADAGDAEGVVVVDVDAQQVADVRHRFPFLLDRRPGAS